MAEQPNREEMLAEMMRKAEAMSKYRSMSRPYSFKMRGYTTRGNGRGARPANYGASASVRGRKTSTQNMDSEFTFSRPWSSDGVY